MDTVRFDALTLAVGAAPSRRGLLRLIGAGLAAPLLAALGRSDDASAICKNDGAKCRRGPECCSGECKGRKKKRKCRAAPGALGCTIDDPYDTRCPNSSDPNHYCWRTITGKPLCGTAVKCFSCASNEGCVQETGNASARCVTVPPEGGCAAQNQRSCVVFP